MNFTKFSNLVKQLNQLEELSEDTDFQFWGMQVWPILKVKLFHLAGYGNRPGASPIEGRSLRAELLLGLQDSLAFLTSLRQLRRADNLYTTQLINRRSKWQGRFFDYYIDPLVKNDRDSNQSSLVADLNIEGVSYGNKHPTYSSTLHLSIARKVCFAIAVMLAPILRRKIFGKKQLGLLQQAVLQMNLSHPEGLDLLLTRTVLSEFLFSKVCQILLKIIRPRRIVVVCYYSQWGWIHAANRAGIPSIDLQHGAQGRHHIAYSYWKKKFNTLPTEFWTWTLEDKLAIQAWGGKAICIGVPYLELAKTGELESAEAARLTGLVNMEKSRSSVRICTVTLQFGTDLGFIKALLDEPSCFFLLRLHPAMRVQEKVQIQDLVRAAPYPNWEIELSNLVSLPLALSLCDLHITLDSAAVLEAAAMGRKSLCLSNYARELFPQEISRGWVRVLDYNLIQDPQALRRELVVASESHITSD